MARQARGLALPRGRPLGGRRSLQYLVNAVRFRTPIYPFIDRSLAAAYYARYYYAEPTGKLQQIRELFWGWPNRLSEVASDAVQGAVGLPWYPVPLFIAAALFLGWRSGNRPFLVLQGVFLGLLLLDPAPAVGRYTVWYQAAGFLSVMLVAQWAGMTRLRYLAPLASAGLAV